MNVSNELLAAPVNGQAQQARPPHVLQQNVPQQTAPQQKASQQSAQQQKAPQQKVQQPKAQQQKLQQPKAQHQNAQQRRAQPQTVQPQKAQTQKAHPQKVNAVPKQGELHAVGRSAPGPVPTDKAALKVAPPKRVNPHCPVPGCGATAPHADDPYVQRLALEFPKPERITHWAFTAMTELSRSMCNDLSEKRIFALEFRLRQMGELYLRTLYAALLADEKELHHLFSGAAPNNMKFFYDEVNRDIFLNTGHLLDEQRGHERKTFTPMDYLNDCAHVSLRSLSRCISQRCNRDGIELLERKHHAILATYCCFLGDIDTLFKAGKTRDQVRARIIKLHQTAVHSVPGDEALIGLGI